MAAVEYVIELFAPSATFGPGTKVAELWDARNLGWSRYDRLPGKSFFTLSQTSAHLAAITPLLTHLKIWRISASATRNVYSGVIVEPDSTGDDVVWSAFDYIALLSLSRAGFKTLYPTKLLGTEIVSPEWTLAKGASSSVLGFVTNGTFENPLGTDGTTTIKTNAQFGTLMQQRLQLIYDISEMGRANTTNHVTFEITQTAPHTFNFWKNKGAVREAAFVLGGNVSDYRYLPNWSAYRNDLATVGVGSAGGAAEIVKTDAGAIAAKGLRQDVFPVRTLLGISGAATEADQQQAVTQQALKRKLQLHPALQLDLIRGGHEAGSLDLSDKVTVAIANGGDTITGLWRLLGERVMFDESGEDSAVIVGPVLV